MATAPPPMTPSAPKKQNTCLIGCLVMGAFTLIGAVVIGLVVWFSLMSIYNQFTDTEPMAIEQVDLAPDEQVTVETKIEDFAKAMNYESDSKTFNFTGDELNAIIGMYPEMNWLADSVYVQVVGSRIFGDVSLPLSRFGLPGDRYFNGQATFEVGLSSGNLSVRVTELSVKGEPVPEQFMQGVASENLAQGFNQDPEFGNMLNRIQSIVVSDGLVIVKLYE